MTLKEELDRQRALARKREQYRKYHAYGSRRSPPSPPLPAGVTLRPIDGGPTYFADNNLTNAVNMGWDSPTFFPIGPFDSAYRATPDAPVWTDVGWNCAYPAEPTQFNYALSKSNNISVVEQAWNLAEDTNVVGNYAADEPESNPATAWSVGFATPIGTSPNSSQDHRFWSVIFTWAWSADAAQGNSPFNWTGSAPIPKNPSNFLQTLISTPNATQRHMDFQAQDIYWFGGTRSGEGGWPTNLLANFSGVTGTQAEGMRGTNYGDMIDVLRAFQSTAAAYSITGHPAPLFSIVEDGGPFDDPGDGSSYIRSEEINWGVWGAIIHGARGIVYFDHTFSGPAIANQNLADNPFNWYTTLHNGSSVTVYDQVKATNALIKSLAPVLNSPFALGFASVSPLGYLFPTPSGGGYYPNGTANVTVKNGIDLCVHYYNRGPSADNKFYIFTTPRNALTDINISATFTVASGTLATVIGESRSISIVAGHFTDTFAHAYTVHIYRIS